MCVAQVRAALRAGAEKCERQAAGASSIVVVAPRVAAAVVAAEVSMAAVVEVARAVADVGEPGVVVRIRVMGSF